MKPAWNGMMQQDAKIFKDLQRQDVYQKEAQILFHWVNLVFEFRIGIDSEPLLRQHAFEQ